MAFDDPAPQAKMDLPEANDYAARAFAWSASVAREKRCVLDVAYGADERQKLDIFLPDAEGAEKLPVLLILHGGRWIHGRKEWMGFMAPPIVSLPALLVSIGYRLAPQHRYPVPLEDCLLALEWVYRHIGEHGGDRERLFIGGHSAGGHLSALATLRRDLVAARGLPGDVIKACFPISATYDLAFTDPQPGSPEAGILSTLFHHPAQASEASPITHVAGNRTPFFLVFGSLDFERTRRTGRRMIEALKEQPGRLESHLFEGLDHFRINLDMTRPDNRWVRTVRAWMAGD